MQVIPVERIDERIAEICEAQKRLQFELDLLNGLKSSAVSSPDPLATLPLYQIPPGPVSPSTTRPSIVELVFELLRTEGPLTKRDIVQRIMDRRRNDLPSEAKNPRGSVRQTVVNLAKAKRIALDEQGRYLPTNGDRR